MWYKVDNAGGEGLAEYLATLVLKNSSLNESEYVSYENIIINGKDGCGCKNCLEGGQTLVSCYRLWAGTMGAVCLWETKDLTRINPWKRI